MTMSLRHIITHHPNGGYCLLPESDERTAQRMHKLRRFTTPYGAMDYASSIRITAVYAPDIKRELKPLLPSWKDYRKR